MNTNKKKKKLITKNNKTFDVKCSPLPALLLSFIYSQTWRKNWKEKNK